MRFNKKLKYLSTTNDHKCKVFEYQCQDVDKVVMREVSSGRIYVFYGVDKEKFKEIPAPVEERIKKFEMYMHEAPGVVQSALKRFNLKIVDDNE